MTALSEFDGYLFRQGTHRRLYDNLGAHRVEGAFRHQAEGDAWEYSVVVSVRNDRGEEEARKVVGVGALGTNEGRTVTVSVDVFKNPEK